MHKVNILAFLLFPVVATCQIADSTEREIKLQGVCNFRDLGGYSTKDGKHVKWNRIYRSAEISHLTENDRSILQQLSINYILDFRGPAEVSAAPDQIPVGATRISLPAGSEHVGDRAQMMKMMSISTSGDSIMLPFYTDLTHFTDRYKPMFSILLNNPNDSALLFHCTAGKDRTGIAAALILYALGVEETIIMSDYLASNYYRKRDNTRMKNILISTYHMNESVAEDVTGVKETYLLATFSAIRSKYGSISNYLQKEMGLTDSHLYKLREKYLE